MGSDSLYCVQVGLGGGRLILDLLCTNTERK
jgi:hypothetical protein